MAKEVVYLFQLEYFTLSETSFLVFGAVLLNLECHIYVFQLTFKKRPMTH